MGGSYEGCKRIHTVPKPSSDARYSLVAPFSFSPGGSLVSSVLDDGEIGTCATAQYLEDDWYGKLLGEEFNRVALKNDLIWKNVHPQRDTFEFGPADRLINFAECHGMTVTGHAFVWHIENPDWLVKRDWSSEALANELRSHIHTLTDRYADRVDTWDVEKEAVNDLGKLRETLRLEHLGEEYIVDAFRWAADHIDADLYYDEYGLTVNKPKQDKVYDVLSNLLDKGVPVDGLGLQFHCVGVHPTPEQIEVTIRRFQELGINVRVTALDTACKLPALKGGAFTMDSRSNQRWCGFKSALVQRPGVYTHAYACVSVRRLVQPTEEFETGVLRRVVVGVK